MNYHIAFLLLKIFQRLFTQWVIMKQPPHKFNMMILARKRKKALFISFCRDFRNVKFWSIIFYLIQSSVSHHIGTINLLLHFFSDSPGSYTSEKRLDSCTIDKNYLKIDVIDGSIVNGLKQPILYSLVLDKTGRYEFLSHLQTKH